MAIQLIDTHCHLYLEEFQADQLEMVGRAIEAGVSDFFLPATESAEHPRMEKLANIDLQRFHMMMGLHPCYVKDNFKDELKAVEEKLSIRRYTAVGEVGLDFYWDRTYENQQVEAFHQQIEWALEYKIPVVIHSRQSIPECIAIIQQYRNRGLTGIFHCFSGSEEEAKAIVAMDFYLGIGGVLTYKNAGLPAMIRGIPLEKLVLETDAPYLAPVPFRGKRNESSYLTFIARKLAEVKGVELEELARVTTATAQKIFQLPI